MLVCTDNLKLAHKFLGRNIEMLNEKTELPENIKPLRYFIFTQSTMHFERV
jgi:hypothetical protein